MAVLLIGEREKAEIDAAIGRARRKPVMLEFLREHGFNDNRSTITLADRKPGFKRPRAEEVLIPIGYRAAVSFEEQPTGMAMHLSISVERADPKLMPNVASIAMIAQAFGIDFDEAQRTGTLWLEEYEPGRQAINILVITAPKEEGHA